MRHNVPWELYDRDAIASAAHFLGYEGRWRFLLPQPGPASSLVNAEGQNKYQEKSLWINEWFSRSFFLVRIKILSCWSSSDDILLFSLLWLLFQLALMTQWRTCQLLSAKQTWKSWCCSSVRPSVVMLKMTGWWEHWMTGWLDDWMTGWPSDRVTEWPSDQVTKWPSDLVTKWQEASPTIDCMVNVAKRRYYFGHQCLSLYSPKVSLWSPKSSLW